MRKIILTALLLLLSATILVSCTKLDLKNKDSSGQSSEAEPPSSETQSSKPEINGAESPEISAAKTVAELEPYAITPIPRIDMTLQTDFDFSQYIMVEKEDKRGIADYEGNILVPAIYDVIYICFDGIAANQNDNSAGIIYSDDLKASSEHLGHGLENSIYAWDTISNKPFNLYMEPFPLDENRTQEKIAGVCKIKIKPTQMEGYIQYDILQRQGKYSFIKDKKLITKTEYDSIHEFSEGLAAVKSNGLWGYIDESGKTVIDFQYDDFYSANVDFDSGISMNYAPYNFSNGYAAVVKGGKWGYIDKSGKEAARCEYLRATDSYNNKAWVLDADGSWKLIDLK